MLKKEKLFLERPLYCSSFIFFNYPFFLLCYCPSANPFPSRLSISLNIFYTEQQTATELQQHLTMYMPAHPAEAIK
jgi:hypothetical protein